MGMSPDAMVFYGIAYTDEDELPEDISDKAYEYEQAEEDKACPQPYPEYDRKRADPNVDPEYAKVWEKWRSVLDKGKRGRCEFRDRGHCDYSMPFVYVTASFLKVEWTEVAEVDTGEDGGGKWNEQLKDYCKVLGLPFRQPKWLLAAYYG